MNPIAILAQTGSGFDEFVAQIPPLLVAFTCIVGLVLLGVMAAIVRARIRRSDSPAPQPPPSFVPAEKSARPQRPTAASDLPDLDLLLDAPSPESIQQPPLRTAPAGAFTVNLTGGETAQVVEVVTIMRDVVDGGLVIQLGDKTYRNLNDNEAFRNSFLKIMRELSPMVNAQPQRPAPPTPEVQPTPVEEEPAAREETPSLRDLMETPAEEGDRPAPKRPAAKGPLPGDLPKYSIEDKPQTVKKRGGLLGREKTEFVPVPELDIAGAIEAYLQHKLQFMSEYADRSIHVHPAEGGGVAIEVDGTYYDAVGDVRDESVRAFLLETIQEWQERNSG